MKQETSKYLILIRIGADFTTLAVGWQTMF
jgi:hypothetical protein